MEHTKDILCPDCNLTYLTTKEEKDKGKCNQCNMREVSAHRVNQVYIPFKLIPENEQKRLLAIRAAKKLYRENKNNNTSTGRGRARKYESDFIDTLRSLSKSCNNREELYIKMKELFTDITFDRLAINNLRHRYGITFRKDNLKVVHKNKKYSDEFHKRVVELATLTDHEAMLQIQKEFPEYDLNRTKFIKFKSTYGYTKKELFSISATPIKIFTDDVIDKMRELASNDKTKRELFNDIVELFPQKPLKFASFVSKMGLYKLPHKDARHSHDNIVDKINEVSDHAIQSIESPIIRKPSKSINNNTANDRLAPIIKEVDDVLNRKYKLLNCECNNPYKTEDYINALKMLQYLYDNLDNIIKASNDHHDIMNRYQSDILHEQENELSEPGNTYFQDKLHILRNKRRQSEYTYTDLEVLRTFISGQNTSRLKIALAKLTDLQQQRQSPIFIPTVDTNMVDKYNWCKQGTLSSKKVLKPILTTNKKIQEATNTLYKYRARCELSGGGFGAYKEWSKDYSAANEGVAIMMANKDINAIKAKNPNILTTELRIWRLN